MLANAANAANQISNHLQHSNRYSQLHFHFELCPLRFSLRIISNSIFIPNHSDFHSEWFLIFTSNHFHSLRFPFTSSHFRFSRLHSTPCKGPREAGGNRGFRTATTYREVFQALGKPKMRTAATSSELKCSRPAS